MDIINTPYWILEFLKVLFGFLLLGFAWPRFVFAGHLRGKSLIYQFGFCVTTQVVLVNTVVLCLGLFHILNVWTVRAIFYGIPLALLVKRLNLTEEQAVAAARAEVFTRPRLMLKRLRHTLAGKLREAWRRVRPHWLECLALAAVAVYALIYFSWGAFQNTSYSYPDQYVHHSWIYGLIGGTIFPNGIYPEAMHCLLYAIHTLLGMEVYSLLLFGGSIQTILFLVACYALFQEIFRWRFTSVFVLTVFVLLGTDSVGVLGGMSRLQGALPLELALTGQMLCVLFLVRYLRGEGPGVESGKKPKLIWNGDLFVFMMSLTMILVAHFHPVITAFVLCVVAVAFHVKRVFSRERFLPLAAAVLCGVSIALAPMGAALVAGRPAEQSIGWALGVISGEDRESQAGALDEALEDEDSGDMAGRAGKWASFTLRMVRRAYSELLGEKWVEPFLILMAVVVAVGAVQLLFLPFRLRWIRDAGLDQLWLGGYLFLAVLSFSMILMYIMPYLGLPELVPGPRLIATERILLFAVAAIPLDFAFYLLMRWLKGRVLQVLSLACMAAICVWASTEENYHGYLYCDLTRYRAEVETMTHIIQHYPKYSYTIVSPVDGLYHVIEYGWHEELLDFMLKSTGDRYFIPTEYVFIFLEKKPLEYAQIHYASGPSWLAVKKKPFAFGSQHPAVIAGEVSLEAAQSDLGEFEKPSDYYKRSRSVVESRVYYWCQRFEELYPNELKVYYEDEDFVCYYFQQEPEAPYDLAIGEYVP